MFSFSTLAVAASLTVVATANHGHDVLGRSHHVGRAGHHQKRDFTGQATYYAVGLGACGQYNVASDFIVALNSAQYGGGYPGPHCFQSVHICRTGTSKCQTATIMDECPTCAYGSLDLSEGLFKTMGTTDEGVFPITWTFGSGDSGSSEPTTTTTKKPTPTTTYKPEPTTTWEPEPTTTWEPPTTTSTKKRTTTSSPPPETTSTPEPTTTSHHTSTTSSTPTTTSTTEVTTSTSSSSSTYISTTSVATTTSASEAAPASASAATASASGSNSGSASGSGSGASNNLANMHEIVLSLGQLANAAHNA